MIILIPWKPVALAIVFMAVLVLIGYFVPFLVEGRNPFADDWNRMQHITASQTAGTATSTQRHAHKTAASAVSK